MNEIQEPEATGVLLWQRPGMVALAILIALAPIPLAIALAYFLRQNAVAFLAVPTSVLLAWWMLRLRGERWADVGLRRCERPFKLLAIVALAVVLLLVASSIGAMLLATLTGLKPDIGRFDILRGNIAVLIGGLLVVWTTAAFGEEMLFRGFLMHSLKRLADQWLHARWSWFVALTISSVLFGLAHAYQGLAGVILTGLIGLAQGIIFFIARRNLWGPILTHGTYDTVGFIIVFLNLDAIAAAI